MLPIHALVVPVVGTRAVTAAFSVDEVMTTSEPPAFEQADAALALVRAVE